MKVVSTSSLFPRVRFVSPIAEALYALPKGKTLLLEAHEWPYKSRLATSVSYWSRKWGRKLSVRSHNGGYAVSRTA